MSNKIFSLIITALWAIYAASGDPLSSLRDFKKFSGASFELPRAIENGELQETAQSTICDSSVQQYSGYFKLSTGDKHYFYWFFESRSAPKTDPVILWMTGYVQQLT